MAIVGFSNYAENKILDHALGTTSWTMPTTYVSLHTADPDEDASGAEVSGGTYARQAASFAAAASGSASTDADLDFVDMPSATVTHVAVWDASSTGNMIAGGALDSSEVVPAAATFTIPSGDLTVTLD